MDSAIHRINHYPVDNAISFRNTYPLDSDLSGKRAIQLLNNHGQMPNYKPILYIKLVCEQNVFCYPDFRSYLKANYPKSLPFALKSIFAFQIQLQKALTTPKTTAKKTSTLVIDMMKIAFSRMLPGNEKCAVTSNYCMTSWRTPLDIYKYRWTLRVYCSLRIHAQSTHCERTRRYYKLSSPSLRTWLCASLRKEQDAVGAYIWASMY